MATYWLVDYNDDFAQAPDADRRDYWLTQGWFVTEQEPRGYQKVWCHYQDPSVQPARFNVLSLPYWTANGWSIGEPPEVVNATNADDPQPIGVPFVASAADTAPGLETPTVAPAIAEQQSAASGSTKKNRS